MIKNLPLYILVIIIIGVAFYFRVIPAYDIVFPESGGVFLLGVDPYFYLRQVETTFQNFPLLQKYDHATHFPNGIVSDATGLYTLFMAGICKVFLGANATSDEMAFIIAWVAPVFACLNLLIVYLISTKLESKSAGLFSILVFLLYPGLSLHRSLLGFPDHHIIEVFLALLIIYSLTVNFKDILNNRYSSVKGALASLPFTLFFCLWPGAPLYIILCSMVFVNFLILFKGDNTQLRSFGLFSITYFGSVGLSYFLIKMVSPDIITMAFSNYTSIITPLLLIIGAFLMAVSRLKEKYNFLNSSALIVLLITLEVIFIWAFFVFTKIGADVYSLLNFRATELAENQPVGWFNLLDMISIPGAIALGYSMVLLYKFVVSRSENLAVLPSIVFTMFFTYFWLNTYDMGYMLAPILSILTGVLLSHLVNYIVIASSGKNIKGMIFRLTSTILLLFTIMKPLVFSSPKYPIVFSEKEVASFLFYNDSWREGMDWLKNNSPELKYPTDKIYKSKEMIPSDSNQYGVLTSWDYGNAINQRAKRIPVWSRWPNVKAAKALYENIDSVDVTELCVNCNIDEPVKYIVVNAKTAGSYFVTKYNAIFENINECFSTRNLVFEDISYNAPSLGSCYESSLVYSLYRGINIDTSMYKLRWESSRDIISGYYFDGNTILITELDPYRMTESELDRIYQYKMFPYNKGLFYNAYIGPELCIYEVLIE